jgi:hypothetical protein
MAFRLHTGLLAARIQRPATPSGLSNTRPAQRLETTSEGRTSSHRSETQNDGKVGLLKSVMSIEKSNFAFVPKFLLMFRSHVLLRLLFMLRSLRLFSHASFFTLIFSCFVLYVYVYLLVLCAQYRKPYFEWITSMSSHTWCSSTVLYSSLHRPSATNDKTSLGRQ